MIQQKDLRIGNLVKLVPAYNHYAPNESGIVEIGQILSQTISCLHDDRRFQFKLIEGIPLSPSILKKCGFKQMKKAQNENYHGNAGLNFGYPVLYWLYLAGKTYHDYLILNP